MPLFLLQNFGKSMKQEEGKKDQKMQPMKSVDAGSHAFFEAQQKVYPRSINGFFMRWRWALVFLPNLFFMSSLGFSGATARWYCLILALEDFTYLGWFYTRRM